MTSGYTFSIHDTAIYISHENKMDDWDTYHAILRFMKSQGFSCKHDPRTARNYPSLKRQHHIGGRQDVRFHADLAGRTMEVCFFEDVPRDNKNGGRYTSHKLIQMPYLRRLKVILMIKKTSAFLESIGMTNTTKIIPCDATAAVMYRRAETENFHRDHYSQPMPSYNCTDRDGVRMKDGDFRYAWSPNGRLIRGIVYANLNSMWWMIVNKDLYWNYSCGELFTYVPEKHGRKKSLNSKVRVAHALQVAINHQEFERAARIRDYVTRTYGSQKPIAKGMKVHVDNPRFHGEGIVEYLKEPLFVGVKLGNGNVWEYERITVRPAL